MSDEGVQRARDLSSGTSHERSDLVATPFWNTHHKKDIMGGSSRPPREISSLKAQTQCERNCPSWSDALRILVLSNNDGFMNHLRNHFRLVNRDHVRTVPSDNLLTSA